MKLIRDNLIKPEHWEWFKEGHRFVRPVHDRDEHLRLLRLKVVEEAGEVATASESDELLAEAGDLFEALISLVEVAGLDWSEVLAVASHKASRRGGYTEGVVWDV